MTGRNSMPGRRSDIGSAPSGVFRANDGFVSMAVVGEKLWQRFCAAIGRADWAADASLSTGPARAAAVDEVLTPGIEAWLADKTREEAVRLLSDVGIPAIGVALPLEVLESEQARARDMIVRYQAFGHTATVTGNPIRFGDEPRTPAGPAPRAGEHTVEILRAWAGLSASRIDELLDAGVIAQSPLATVE
jgi:formyl-CoA transferase